MGRFRLVFRFCFVEVFGTGSILGGFSAGLWVARAVRSGEFGLWEVVTA